VNGVYYPAWRVYKGESPSSLPLGFISHVFYSFAWVREDGTVYLSDEWADTQIEVDGTKGCLNSFRQLKEQYTQLKVILSVGGGGKGSDSFAAVAENPQRRETFARTAHQLVIDYGLDGIDIDWEHPSDRQQGRNYVLLLQNLRRYLPSSAYTLTTALPAGEWALQHIPLGEASRYLNFINLMAYDYAGSWTPASGHHAQLYTPNNPHSDAARISGQTAVSYLRSKGVPAEKIVFGVPTYGRSFLGTNNVGQAYIGHGGEEGTFEYKDLPRPGSTEYVDEGCGAAYCTGHDGGFVSYDNPDTVRQKVGFVKQHGLGGIFFWTGTGDAKGPRSLVETSFNSLHR